MVISAKQQEANRRNAQHSTGPQTPEGKAKVSRNAIKHGLRARRTPIHGESEQEFHELCDALEAEWQPQTPSEMFFVEQLATSQWMLARLARHERMAFEILIGCDPIKDQSARDRVEFYARQKTRFERSYAKAIRDLLHLRKERAAAARVKPAPSPQVPAPDPWPLTPAAQRAAAVPANVS